MAIKPKMFVVTISKSTSGWLKADKDKFRPHMYDRVVFRAPVESVLIILNSPNTFPTQTFVVERGKNVLLEVSPHAPNRDVHFMMVPLESPFIPGSNKNLKDHLDDWLDELDEGNSWLTEISDSDIEMMLLTDAPPEDDVEILGKELIGVMGKPRNPRRQ